MLNYIFNIDNDDFNLNEILSFRYNGFTLNEKENNKINISIEDDDFNYLCKAISDVIVKDIALFEIVKFLNNVDIASSNKKKVFIIVAEKLRIRDTQAVLSKVSEYLKDNNFMNINGFIMFRLKNEISIWRSLVIETMDEVVFKDEYLQTMELLGALLQLTDISDRTLSVRYNKNGSYTISEDSGESIILYTNDAIINLLIDLAPKNIIVYDDSIKGHFLNEVLLRIFSDRVCFVF